MSADGELHRRLVAEVTRSDVPYQLPLAISVDQAQERFSDTFPAVILLDESARRSQSLEETAREFACIAPVIVLAGVEQQEELAALVALGDVEFVARGGNFLPLVLGLLDRRMRWAEQFRAGEVPGSKSVYDFLEFLRHEVNNPLTGILGNAEILLARRDRLPAAVAQRLETIAGLAVRLREAVRQLSWASEGQPHHVRSA